MLYKTGRPYLVNADIEQIDECQGSFGDPVAQVFMGSLVLMAYYLDMNVTKEQTKNERSVVLFAAVVGVLFMGAG